MVGGAPFNFAFDMVASTKSVYISIGVDPNYPVFGPPNIDPSIIIELLRIASINFMFCCIWVYYRDIFRNGGEGGY